MRTLNIHAFLIATTIASMPCIQHASASTIVCRVDDHGELLLSQRADDARARNLGLQSALARSGDDGFIRLRSPDGSKIEAKLKDNECLMTLVPPNTRPADESRADRAGLSEYFSNVAYGRIGKPASRDGAFLVAQTKDRQEPKEPKIEWPADMAIPDVPAATVIGATPGEVIKATSTREFVVGLVKNIDKDGGFKDGLQIEFSPFQRLKKEPPKNKSENAFTVSKREVVRLRKAPPGEPEDNRNAVPEFDTKWALANLRLSFAVANSSDAAISQRLGVGILLPLIDDSDPRTHGAASAENCLALLYNISGAGGDFRTLVDQGRGVSGDYSSYQAESQRAALLRNERDALETRMRTMANAKCPEIIKKEKWHQQRLSIGLGQAWNNLKTGDKSYEKSNNAYWITYGTGIGEFVNNAKLLMGEETEDQQDQARNWLNWMQVHLHARRTGREKVAVEGSSNKEDKSKSTVALQFTAGNPDLHASFTYSRNQTDQPSKGRKKEFSRIFNAEFKVRKDLWFTLTAGPKDPTTEEKKNPFVLANIRFGSASEPGIKPMP